ncbi:MAG: hypothetical protein M1825_004625 [Sarcosagium campestre]|nr:MAG: hypothetical protein M1825_004625 [Sarcosagium campestre]
MSPQSRATLIVPPTPDPSKSAIENVLELRPLAAIGPDIFTNTRQLWHPPGARGVFGGAVIAQCLAAAQQTVPANFAVHSMHCYFVLAGDSEVPILYHVEHIREGRSFATRTVQARQKGKPIFTTTMSFVKEGSGGKETIQHSIPMGDVSLPVDNHPDMRFRKGEEGPFQSQRVDILNNSSMNPYEKKTRQWVKARGTISAEGGHEAHLTALAYMSDSWFIGTAARVQGLAKTPEFGMQEEEGGASKWSAARKRPEIGMIVSMDHTIYFHDPRGFRADEWMLAQMSSPWAGDGRAVVQEQIFTREGKLIATCHQEGIVRLKQAENGATSKL